MSFFNILSVGSSGLTSQRIRQEIISSNIANASTTRTAEGGPYVRKDVVFRSANVSSKFGDVLASHLGREQIGVKVAEIIKDQAPPEKRFQPNHPDADAEGFVSYPNVNVIEEMINMVEATRSYEANLSVINSTKSMALGAIDLGN
jgi:flagellar basal-body rod protein FlgC